MEKPEEKKTIGPQMPKRRVLGPFLNKEEYNESPNEDTTTQDIQTKYTPTVRTNDLVEREEWMLTAKASEDHKPRLNYKELQKNVTSFSRKGVYAEKKEHRKEDLERMKKRDEEYEEYVKEYNVMKNRQKSLYELHQEKKIENMKKRKRDKDKKDEDDKESKSEKKDKRDKKKDKKEKKKDKKKSKQEEFVPFFDRDRDVTSGYNPGKKSKILSNTQSLGNRFSTGSFQKYL